MESKNELLLSFQISQFLACLICGGIPFNQNIDAQFIPIEMTPKNVGSLQERVFSTLPTTDPALFGIPGDNVHTVDFYFDPTGMPIPDESNLTNQYESVGVLMNNIRVDNVVYEGPASAPNATEDDAPH
ncbi:MAG: hypothetical protein AAGA30_09665 [Planctomycetota bacterium]